MKKIKKTLLLKAILKIQISFLLLIVFAIFINSFIFNEMYVVTYKKEKHEIAHDYLQFTIVNYYDGKPKSVTKGYYLTLFQTVLYFPQKRQTLINNEIKNESLHFSKKIPLESFNDSFKIKYEDSKAIYMNNNNIILYKKSLYKQVH